MEAKHLDRAVVQCDRARGLVLARAGKRVAVIAAGNIRAQSLENRNVEFQRGGVTRAIAVRGEILARVVKYTLIDPGVGMLGKALIAPFEITGRADRTRGQIE